MNQSGVKCAGAGREKRRAFLLVLLAGVLSLGGCADFAPPAKEERVVEIGLLLRRQFNEDVTKDRICRHIDILLADNSIVGFNVAEPEVQILKYMFLHTPGKVRDFDDLNQIRQYYIYADKAMNVTHKGKPNQKMVTWWAHLYVTQQQADKLHACWDEMAKNPPDFRLWGDNCASRAAESLVCAGILPPGLPGLDTPENVLKRVKTFYPDVRVEEGYFGFDEAHKPYLIPLSAVHPELKQPARGK